MPEKRLNHHGSQPIVEHPESGSTCQPSGSITERFAQEKNSHDSETAKIPAIRFRGFTDAWEQRKLGEMLERRQIIQQISPDAPRLAFAAGQGVIPLSERKTNNRDQLISDEATKKYLLTE